MVINIVLKKSILFAKLWKKLIVFIRNVKTTFVFNYTKTVILFFISLLFFLIKCISTVLGHNGFYCVKYIIGKKSNEEPPQWIMQSVQTTQPNIPVRLKN